ncbi:hypothetical protein D3C78_1735650 [compost metagenome]
MAAIVSRKQPTNNISRLTSTRNIHLLSVIVRIAADRSCAAWLTVRSHAKTEAAATMKSTEAVVSMVSKVDFASVLKVIVR